VAIGPRLDLRQSQALVMTPQLRQAIKLLQCSNLEVAAFVAEELERNPFLEIDERPLPGPDAGPREERAPALAETAPLDAIARAEALPSEAAAPLDVADWSNVYDAGEAPLRRGGRAEAAEDEEPRDIAAAPLPLRERLAQEIRLAFADRTDRLIAAHMLALLEPSGRLSVPDAAIAAALGCPPDRVARIRARMMRFEPVGMFAASLKECLAVQLAERNRLDPAMAALLDNLELLARRDLRALQAACGVDAEDLAEMIAEIRRLDPKPGADADAPEPATRVPDILLRRGPGGEWLLELNPETLPRVLVNRGFHARAVVGARTREERAFLADRLAAATWLVKSLEQRATTILKVAAEVVRRQEAFLRHGIAHLRPLTLRDVAEAVEMHESTISRVTAGKSIATPRGVFDLKFFFTTAIAGTTGETHSAEAVRHRIRELIAAESPDDVLSDDALVARLRAEGVDIARRTVAKYRESLRIPSSVQRKREKAAAARLRAAPAEEKDEREDAACVSPSRANRSRPERRSAPM
jgi:RNA polymerase sigma-54 factor